MSNNNQAFIDGQNLHLATTRSANPWKIDFKRFRIYLQQKHRVDKAYYFLGAYDPNQQRMYTSIQENGYVLVFREHGIKLRGEKKGNVDVDIVFHIMQKLHKQEDFGKVVLVSGDGDYKRMVDYLIEIDKFEKLLMPCKEHGSSLYKQLTSAYYMYLDRPDMRVKLGYVPENEKGS